MNLCPILAQALRLLVAGVFSVALLMPAAAADAVFPVSSRLGLVPPPGLKPATAFPGFEDPEHGVFIRLVALPGNAFADIEKTMTNDALKKQGLTVDKRETLPLGKGNASVTIVRQDTGSGPIRKWLLVAPIDDLTALVSLEMPVKPPAPYTDEAIRTALLSLAARAHVPVDEQLTMVPFKIGDTANLRLVRVVPGAAVQFTDGPKDPAEAIDQPQLVIAVSPGGPAEPRDRDQFARNAMSGLPPFKELRITNAEPMRIGGQPGHEVRAQAKDPQTGADVEIVQWLRFGTGAYLRILGFGPKDKWTDTFMRFRAIRDGLEPR
jgi:hypothetical protein